MSRFVFVALLLTGIVLPAFGQETAPEPYEPHKRKDYLVTIHTEFGDMVLVLYNETPLHKANFLKLAKEGYFDSTCFHRVINGFMIQGGDPNSKPGGNAAQIGNGGPEYTIPAEFNPEFTHKKGALASARQPDQINPEKASSGSQFYIVQSEAGCRHLNGSYTVFGQVLEGLDVIDTIAKQRVGPGARPIEPIRMSVEVEYLRKKKILKRYEQAE